MQYLRILLNSFGEEDFQKFNLHLICYVQIVFDCYFANNVVGATILTKFHTHILNDLICILKSSKYIDFRRKVSKRSWIQIYNSHSPEHSSERLLKKHPFLR